MARIVKPPPATQVQNAKPKDKPYKIFDGGGLYLQVSPGGGKHWKMKYVQASGKESLLSFGPYPEVSLILKTFIREEKEMAKEKTTNSVSTASTGAGDISNQPKLMVAGLQERQISQTHKT